MYNYSIEKDKPDDGKYEEYSEKELINALRKRDDLIKKFERKMWKWEKWQDHWKPKIENAHRLDMVNEELQKTIENLEQELDEERAMKEKLIEERDEFKENIVYLEAHIEHMKFRMDQEKGQNLLVMKSKGMSYREIAQKTGLPLGTVKSRISKARRSTRPK